MKLNTDARNRNKCRICQPSVNESQKPDQSLNFSRYFVASPKASSTLLTSVPLPIATGALPPALPPTMLDTALAHSLADAPLVVRSY